MFRPTQKPEPFKNRSGIGLALDIRKDPLRFFTRMMNAEGAYCWLSISGRKVLALYDAAGVEHVLQENAGNYRKGYFQNILKSLFGQSMFLDEGEPWRKGRVRAAPVFASGNFEEMLKQMGDAANAMFDRWAPHVARGEPIDMTLEMTRFALDALLRALFHSSRDDVATEMRENLGVILRDTENRLWSIFNLPEIIAHNLTRYRKARRFLKRMTAALIETRLHSQDYPEDLLSRLVNDFGATPDEQRILYDEVLSFVLAGHDTTAHGLAWALYSLGTHLPQQKKMEQEVETILGNRMPGMADIKNMPYTRQVFDEMLRLYPPVWTMSREAIKDDKIPLDDGSFVDLPADAAVMMCHYAVHRREKYWRNPEAFDPERFTPEEIARRPKFAWFPFGGGPRLCLGFRFAQVESVLALAMITQRYELTLLPGQEVVPEPIITLRPRGALLFRVTERAGWQSTVASVPIMPEPSLPDQKKGKCPFH